MSDQAENDARIDHAFELATYILKHPTNQHLLYRIAYLADKTFGDPELGRLVEEVEYWLGLLEWQAKKVLRGG